MSFNTPDARRLGRTGRPSNTNRRIRANFARAATISAFGRHAWALDEIDFVDRLPDQAPRRLDSHLARGAA